MEEEEDYNEYEVLIKVVNSPFDSTMPLREPLQKTVRGITAKDEDDAIDVAKEILETTQGYIQHKGDYAEVTLVSDNYDKIRGSYKRNLNQNYGTSR